MLSSLTLEEIIGLRLELAAKAVNYKLYGVNMWHALPDIVKEGVLKYVFSAARTKGEMARLDPYIPTTGHWKATYRRIFGKIPTNIDVQRPGDHEFLPLIFRLSLTLFFPGIFLHFANR